MKNDILLAIEEIKAIAKKDVQENLEEMPYFNRKLKNVLMDRLFEIYKIYKVEITIEQIEDLVDKQIFPIINDAGMKAMEPTSEQFLKAVNDFVTEVNPEGELLPADEMGKSQLEENMGKFMHLSEESTNNKVDFTVLFEEIFRIVNKAHSLNPENIELIKEVKSSLTKTSTQAEEYYAEKNKDMPKNTVAKAEEIYNMYIKYIDQHLLEAQEINTQDDQHTSFF